MKGKLFVYVYSVVLLGLFSASCYLMTIVNPPPLPNSDTRKHHVVRDTYSRDSLQPHENPDYGLEKIPDGVDADEFRKRLLAKVNKCDLEREQTSYEPGKRVVPPIWPSDDIVERNSDKQKSKETNPRGPRISSVVKAYRRSVNDDNLHNQTGNPGSILLKIVDVTGHNNIEITFVSGDNVQTKKLKKNKRLDQIKSNGTTQKMHEDVIEIKADDVILLNIVDDSDIILDKTVLCDANNTNEILELVMNKTRNNETNLVNTEEAEKKVKEKLMDKEAYTFSFLLNSENKTIDSNNFTAPEHNSNPIISNKTLENINDTSISNETKSLDDY